MEGEGGREARRGDEKKGRNPLIVIWKKVDGGVLLRLHQLIGNDKSTSLKK